MCNQSTAKGTGMFFSFAIKQKKPIYFYIYFTLTKVKIHHSVKLTFLLRQEMLMEEYML